MHGLGSSNGGNDAFYTLLMAGALVVASIVGAATGFLIDMVTEEEVAEKDEAEVKAAA